MHRWGNKKEMTGDDPPYLSVGTEVSAKYKGAFCEAKIRKVVKTVKCKVQYKNDQGSIFVNDDQIKGVLMAGAPVEVKQPEKKEAIEGTIVKIQDLSQYTVVFDDGDIATLRRTALCLKSGRHFAESDTLDQLPLTHPEHFSTPVVSGARGSRRRDDTDENSDEEEKQPKVEREEDMGKVVCVEIGDKKKTKDNWFPGLVVAPNAQDSVKIDVEDEYLVRSFKDGRYYTVPKSETAEFTREIGHKVDNPTLKQAVEKALYFLDKDDLPPHWDRDQLFGMAGFPSDIDASDTDSTDDEPREEKDHFVAQLYKFMDDRGTPINKGPVISSKDVDLYKLFKVVYKLGGYNRVTNRNQWKSVTLKLGYTASQTNNVKSSYKKFLHSFEDFYRKLGCTLLTTTRDNKLRSRSNRSLIRDRDKTQTDKFLDREEHSSLHSDDSNEITDSNTLKEKPEIENKQREDSDTDAQSEVKKGSGKLKNSKDQSVDCVKDDDAFKKRLDIPLFKDFGQLPPNNFKEVKDDKSTNEKKNDRKTLKSAAKAAELSDKKNDKTSFKIKSKRLKSVKKKLIETEIPLIRVKPKRSLKERMEAIVQKIKKLKSTNGGELDKKKRITPDDLNKMPLFSVKVKNKEDQSNNGQKSRKLSLGSNDGKTSTNTGSNLDKKCPTGMTGSSSSVDSSTSINSVPNKLKKNDDDCGENYKKKSTSRKKKDDDKFSNNTSDSLINQAIDFVPHYKSICIGDKLRVYYEPTHESKVTYEAKVTNKREGIATEYLVHYTGWNTRYDEWIRRSRIADNLSWTPTRTKKKGNQCDVPSSSHVSTQQNEQPTLQNLTSGKTTTTDKSKRSSTSPIPKCNARNSIKGGVKRLKKMKNKFDGKPKKMFSQKDVDSGGSGSEGEIPASRKRQVLQKTRSRTEKQKQQGSEAAATKENVRDIATDSKKRCASLKRTRPRLVSSEATKKRKVPSTKCEKSNKSGGIRGSIKSLVSRRKRGNRIKDSTTKEEKMSNNSTDASHEISDKEAENIKNECDDVAAPDVLERTENDKEQTPEMAADLLLVLQIPPLDAEKISEFENEAVGKEKGRSASVSSVDSEVGPPILKKEITTEEETSGVRLVNTLNFTDSYLSENLDSKPKINKSSKTPKKETDDKICSPPKVTSARCSTEKTPVKSLGDGKEKTFFTSRLPSEKKCEKNVDSKKCELGDKDKKEPKFRNVNTLNSYLTMDKIDSIKKVGLDKSTPDKTNEKQGTIPKLVAVDSTASNREDDVYEFKEPEPSELRGIDCRTILHRRPASRIFEDTNHKRPKPSPTASDTVIKDGCESSKFSDETNSVEIKSIMDIAAQQQKDVDKMKSANDVSVPSKLVKDDDLTSSDQPEKVTKIEGTYQMDAKVDVSRCDVYASEETCDDIPEKGLDLIAAAVSTKEKLLVCVPEEEGKSSAKCAVLTFASVEEIVDEDAVVDADDDEESTDEPKLIILDSDAAALVEKLPTVVESPNAIVLGAEKKVISSPADDKPDYKNVTESNRKVKWANAETKNALPEDKLTSSHIGGSFVADEPPLDQNELEKITSQPIANEMTTEEESPSTIAGDADECSTETCGIAKESNTNTVSVPSVNEVAVTKKCDPLSVTSPCNDTNESKRAAESNNDNFERLDKLCAIREAESSRDISPSHSVINEVEINVFTASKLKEPSDTIIASTAIITDPATDNATASVTTGDQLCIKSDEHPEIEKSKHEMSQEKIKLKQEEDEVVNNGLLCGETIPKSPESKETLNDVDMSYSDIAVVSSSNSKNSALKQTTKIKKKRQSSYASIDSVTFENQSPISSESSCSSTPGTSPSEEINGFSSNLFSLNEKSCANKDASENEITSDNSEKSVEVKKFLNDETYCHKNSTEYEAYLKKKIDKEASYKSEEPSKKKSKFFNAVSSVGSEKDDSSDCGNSPKTTSSPQKSSIAALLSDCPADLDSNQRIEYLEQKLHTIRRAYNVFKQEVATIDRRRKKLRRKEREGRMMTRNEANLLL